VRSKKTEDNVFEIKIIIFKESTMPDKKIKRSYIRYEAEKNTIGMVGLQDSPKEFLPQYIGLVFSEAYRGCGMVLLYSPEIKTNALCIVQCGVLNPIKARVAWITRLDAGTIKVGFEYLT